MHMIMPPVVQGGAVAVPGIAAEGLRTPLILKDLEHKARQGTERIRFTRRIFVRPNERSKACFQ